LLKPQSSQILIETLTIRKNLLMCISKITLCVLVAVAMGAAQEFAIRADVNLVQLPATVTNREGHPVTGLVKDAFAVFVDDVLQPVTVFHGEDAPVTAGIVVDNSASMAPKREEVIAAAMAFAHASNPKDQMFVVHFNGHARLGLPVGTLFTGNVAELEAAVSAFELGGTTAFYDALLMAESQFRRAAYSRKVLLTITDGGDNSSHTTLAETSEGAVKAGIAVYSVGIFDANDPDRNPQVLSQIAKQTGGAAFFPEQLSDVTKICINIAETVRKQYTIGFPGVEDGKYHRIRVVATDPKYGPLEVHTRSGYIAVKPSTDDTQD
jgi:Ca-activated chloride channel homolog